MKRVAACMLTALLLLSAVPVSTMASEGTTDVGIAEAGYHDILLETAPIFGTVAENAREPASDADAGATIGATNEYFSGAGRETGVLFSWEEESDEPSSAAAGQAAGEPLEENLSSGETASGEVAYADSAADETYADQVSDILINQVDETYADQASDIFTNQTDETYADQASDIFTNQADETYADQASDIFTNQADETYPDQMPGTNSDQTAETFADQVLEDYSGRTEEIIADQADGEETSLNQLPIDDMTGQTDYEDPSADEVLTEEETVQADYEDSSADEILTEEENSQADYEDPGADETLTEEETVQADYEDPAADETLTEEETGQTDYEDPSADEVLTEEETVQADYEDPAADEILTGEENGQADYEDPSANEILAEEETGGTDYEDPAADETLIEEENSQADYEDPAADEILTGEENGQADYEDPAADEILTGEENGQADYEDPSANETLTEEETVQADYEDPGADETLTEETDTQTVYEEPAVEQVPSDMAAEEKQPAEEAADPAGGVYNNAADVPTGGEIDDFAVTEEESTSPAFGASEALPADAAEGSSVETQTDPDTQKTGEAETDENGEKTEDTDNSVPASVDDRAALMGMSLSLTDQIVMNIYVRTDSSVEGDDYIEFDCAGNTVRQMVRDAGASQMTMADGETIDVLIFEMPLRLRQMTDDVTFHMVVDDEAGRSLTRTVRSYADQILAGFFPEEQKSITKAMLNCGAYVQDYFGYNTDRPANAGIFAEGSNPVSDWEDPDMSSFGYSLQLADSSQAFRFIETTLELKEDISLICYYTMEYDWIDLFSDYSFKLKNSDKELEMGYDRDKGMYYVKVSHIMPYELDQVFELEVEKGLLWFNPQSVATLKYSPLSYCREMLQSPDSSDSIRNLCKSLYYYWQAASTVR